MKTLTLDLMLVMVRPFWGGELVGAPFRPCHMFGPSEFDIASWRRSFQFSVLASLIALKASQQALIHSCWFWWIVQQRQFQEQILAHTCGVIQGLNFLVGFDFPTWIVVAEMRISLKRDMQVWIFGKIIHFWHNIVGKTWSINAIMLPSSRVVTDLVIYLNDWRVVGATNGCVSSNGCGWNFNICNSSEGFTLRTASTGCFII